MRFRSLIARREPRVAGVADEPAAVEHVREDAHGTPLVEWLTVHVGATTSPRSALPHLPRPLRPAYRTDLLEPLGPHTTGKGCLYVKRLDDVDRAVLTDLVRRAWETNNERPC